MKRMKEKCWICEKNKSKQEIRVNDNKYQVCKVCLGRLITMISKKVKNYRKQEEITDKEREQLLYKLRKIKRRKKKQKIKINYIGYDL